jgi:maltose-binding protein MalE
MYLVDRFGGGDAFPRALAGEIRFDADPFVKAAQLYQSWVKKGYFGGKPLEETYGDAMQLLATGKASMMVTGSWMCSMYSSESFTNQTIGFYAFPVVTGGMGSMTDVMGMTDLGFAATRQAESNKDAVVRFMTYAMSVKAGNTEPGRISSVPGVQAANPLAAMAAAILGKAEYAQSWWDQDLPAALVTPTSRMIRSFFLSRTDIQAELAKYAVLALENIEIANY